MAYNLAPLQNLIDEFERMQGMSEDASDQPGKEA